MADEEQYEPHFDRLGVHRRVLGHITEEDHVGRGPRNTAERLTEELSEDPYTPFDGDEDDVQEYLDDLEASGLGEEEEGRCLLGHQRGPGRLAGQLSGTACMARLLTCGFEMGYVARPPARAQ